MSAKKTAGPPEPAAVAETPTTAVENAEGAAPVPAPVPAPVLRGVAALPADFSFIAPDVLPRALGTLWRAVTHRETPPLPQLEGRIKRVDVDATAGYLAVHSLAGMHHTFGLRRDALPYLVAHLTKRTLAAVRAELAKGPARIDALVQPKEPAQTDLEGVGDDTLTEDASGA